VRVALPSPPAHSFSYPPAPPSSHTSPQGKSQPKSAHKVPVPVVQPPPLSLLQFQDLFKNAPQSTLVSRGLSNPTNTCFVNVVLQSLMHSNVFLQLVDRVATNNFPTNMIPVFSKFIQLNKEFKPSKRQPPPPLLPEFFFDLLLPFSERTGIPHKTGDSINQQDAQEFMTFLLDMMHEELLPLLDMHEKVEQNGQEPEEESEEWEEVGKKNKSAIIVSKGESFAASPISLIFGGKLRSIVKRQGAKSSVTIQPFYCLHLDIDVPQVKNIEDALTLFMSPEQLEGYTCSKRNVEVQAQKQTTIEQLPRVMMLHLKRFAYDTSQAHKLDKFVSFPLRLAVKNSFLSTEKIATEAQKQYSLFAVVSHHGKVPAKGHYTCDIFSKGEWLEFDDSHVSRVTSKFVLSRKAYLLLYQQP